MSFETAQPITKTPSSIRGIRIVLEEIPDYPVNSDPFSGAGETMTLRRASYWLEVLDQDGQSMSIPHDQGDLIPHLTTAQKTGLLQFMTDLRLKAEAELLP